MSAISIFALLINNPTPYTIIRRRVKHARISINPASEVRIVIPLYYRQRDLEKLLEEKEKWIAKQLAHFAKERENIIALKPGEILFFGEIRKVDFDTSSALRLKRWYMEQANEYFSKRITEIAFHYGFTFNKMTVRGQKTRWGSCSRKKNISLNWKLMKAPPFIIDYLIIHELTHTQIFNHSKAFWAKVSGIMPDYKKAEAWLKKHGKHL